VNQNVHAQDIKNQCFAIPPLAEQTAIAEFLDRETAKIDGLVAEQRRLMELLKEKRQAVISHAVTKGLNPHAPMKLSGIEWLGDVPGHWEVTRLGFLCFKIGSGKTPSGGGEAYLSEGITFIRSQNVYDDGLRLDDVVYVSEETDAEQSWSRVLPGDILLNITGASLGRTCLVPSVFDRANVNQHVCILRLASAASRTFIAMVLKSSGMKSQFDSAQNGAAREGLNFAQISKLALAVPPQIEQDAIVRHLETELLKFDTLTAEAQRAIDLLQERRTALISAAVTGQIDVRQQARN
jgi:type I restriction enzyme S subunit